MGLDGSVRTIRMHHETGCVKLPQALSSAARGCIMHLYAAAAVSGRHLGQYWQLRQEDRQVGCKDPCLPGQKACLHKLGAVG